LARLSSNTCDIFRCRREARGESLANNFHNHKLVYVPEFCHIFRQDANEYVIARNEQRNWKMLFERAWCCACMRINVHARQIKVADRQVGSIATVCGCITPLQMQVTELSGSRKNSWIYPRWASSRLALVKCQYVRAAGENRNSGDTRGDAHIGHLCTRVQRCNSVRRACIRTCVRNDGVSLTQFDDSAAASCKLHPLTCARGCTCTSRRWRPCCCSESLGFHRTSSAPTIERSVPVSARKQS